MVAPTGRWAWLQRASHHFEKGLPPFFVAPPHHIIASPDVCVLSHPIIPPLTHQFCHSSPHKSYQRPPPPTNQTPLAEMLKSKIRNLPFRKKTVIFALAKGRRPVTKASSFFSALGLGATTRRVVFSTPGLVNSTPGLVISTRRVEIFTRRVKDFTHRTDIPKPGFENPTRRVDFFARRTATPFGTNNHIVG